MKKKYPITPSRVSQEIVYGKEDLFTTPTDAREAIRKAPLTPAECFPPSLNESAVFTMNDLNEVAGHYATLDENKPKGYLGIDPGKSGGVVCVDERGKLSKWVIPLIGDDVDCLGLYEIFQELKSKYSLTVILEEVHSLHKMSAATNFSMGNTLGIIQGIIVASRLKMIRVQPKSWQKEIWITSEIEYKPKKPDDKKAQIDTKMTSKKAAHRLFPGEDFRKSARASVPHDGLCDAACMAEYGRRKNL